MPKVTKMSKVTKVKSNKEFAREFENRTRELLAIFTSIGKK